MNAMAVIQASDFVSWYEDSFFILIAAGGFLILLICVLIWMKFIRKNRFPEFEVEPRLGASHAAGIGAVISFSSTAVPPARQRAQLPDYVRRA